MADKKVRRADVVICGGGASGLAAAIETGMRAPDLDVLVIEKMPEPGRKIRATGSGRCNISNTGAEGFVRIMEFFRRIGLVTRTCENGLVYPYSESAADVADLLTARASELGVGFACGEEVTSVSIEGGGSSYSAGDNLFRIVSVRKDREGVKETVTEAPFLILATGGKAGPSFGTTGDGYRLAKGLGHSIVTPVPALTAVECTEWNADSSLQAVVMAGTRTKANVTLAKSGTSGTGIKLFEESGEIQFTRFGLSGICIFNITRLMRYDRKAGESLSDFVIHADLFPDGDTGDFLRDRRANAFAGEKVKDVLRTVLKESIAAYVTAVAGEAAADPGLGEREVADMTDGDIEAVSSAVHCLTFRPEKLRGWNDAQITMGGVSLDELDPLTSGSLIADGLYITGELADKDLPCGGFNLSNAWLTGLAAADDIIRRTR